MSARSRFPGRSKGAGREKARGEREPGQRAVPSLSTSGGSGMGSVAGGPWRHGARDGPVATVTKVTLQKKNPC